jgi:hypothetical protein
MVHTYGDARIPRIPRLLSFDLAQDGELVEPCLEMGLEMCLEI